MGARNRDRSPGNAARVGLCLLLLCPSMPAAGAGEAEPGRLPESGLTLERELEGGKAHRYPLGHGEGEELWLVVVQEGIDVTVSIVDAAGAERLTVDSPSGLWGEEWLLYRVPAASDDAVEIRSLAPDSAPGRYRLRVEWRSPAAPAEPRRHAAEKAVTEAGRLINVGARESLRHAVDLYREALAAWREIERPAEAAHTLFLLGMLQRQLDEPREALALLRQALAAWQNLNDVRGQARALTEMASTARLLGEGERVESAYREALGLWRQLGDLQGEARTLNYLGLVRARSAPESALEPYRVSLELFRRLGDVQHEGAVLNNLGGIHDLMGEPRLALERFGQALDIQQRRGDLRQEAAIWNNIASVHRRTGRFQQALEGYRAALEVWRQLGDARGQGRVLNNLGLTWLSLGDATRAQAVLRDALLLRRDSEDKRGEAITLHNLGLAAAELRAWDEALDLWTQALALRRTLRDRDGEAASLVAMGRAKGELGRLAPARQHLEDALAILAELGNRWRQAQALSALGHVMTAADEPAEARTALARSLDLYRATGDQTGEGEALIELARAERADGRLPSAYANATAALDLLEAVRSDVDSLGLKATFLSRHGDAFELAVDLAMDLQRRDPSGGWAARALEVSERSRARSLLDLLKESGAGRRQGVDAALLDRQQELLDRLSAKVERRRELLDREGPSAEGERLAGEVGEVLARLDEVENQIRRQSPGWDALTRPRPLAADDVRALLDPTTTLLEYDLGEERSFLWVVTAKRIESFELPGRAAVEAAARDVLEGLRVHDPRAEDADRAATARLSGMILAPAAARLAGRRLAIVADGALHYVPFAALPDPAASAEPLLVRHEIVNLPSASALGLERRLLAGRPSAAKTLAVLADPVFGPPDPRLPAAGAGADPADRDAGSDDRGLERLAWSRWEAEAIAAHAGDGKALVLLGFDANLEAVRGGRLRGYRVVHFATHGVIESDHPELSALVLSLYDAAGCPRDGFLRLPEITNLDLDADLVVLSGCRTALGREIRGEGLVGLTRGFFAAGARHLVASLWRVQDRAAAELMDRFYRRLLRGGRQLRPAAALREAQLELRREPELRDPYYWAAFAVYGDWR